MSKTALIKLMHQRVYNVKNVSSRWRREEKEREGDIIMQTITSHKDVKI